MKKIGLLTTLLFSCLLLIGCNKPSTQEIIDDCIIPEDCNNGETEEFISYYDNGAIREKGIYINGIKQGTRITYDEGGNVINIEEYMDGELVEDEQESNKLSVNEDEILSVDELKKACEEQLKEVEPTNPVVTRNEEKLFINTYGFKGVTKSEGIHNESPTYCHVNLKGLVLNVGFYLDEGQSMDELHEEIDYIPGSPYPKLKNFYGFVGGIIVGDTLQTNNITRNNTLYYDPYRGIALKLGEEFNGGLIREIDTDEGGYPHGEVIFLEKGTENEKNRTGIDGYKEVFSIIIVSKEIAEDFKIINENIIGENNKYYFIKSGTNLNDKHFNEITLFDIEDII